MTETSPETVAHADDLPTPPTTTPQPVDEAPTPPAEEPEQAPAPRAPRPVIGGPVGATGRRKEAIARVRLVPGAGQWTINGRSLEDYFPNKVHQQVVNDPLAPELGTINFDLRGGRL